MLGYFLHHFSIKEVMLAGGPTGQNPALTPQQGSTLKQKFLAGCGDDSFIL